MFGSAAAETIVADPAWPGLVSAVNAADPARWSPTDLLHVAAEHLADVDPDRTIPAYQYARAITYTVDLLASHPETTEHPLPDQPPLHPDDEEQLPPDQAQVLDTTGYGNELPPDPEIFDPGEDLGNLQFEDLSPTRVPPPPLPAALADVHALRDQIAASAAAVADLQRAVAADIGPAMRAAADQITDMRARATADRPYLLAVQDVIAQWADADADYEAARAAVADARARLEDLRSQPDADPLDIASAQLEIKLLSMQVPSTSPAERFLPDLTTARQARAAAAGGPDRIISNDDADAYLTELRDTDDRALRTARGHLHQLRGELDRAELAAAAAFADAETRSAEHITAQLDQLATELRVLQVAATYQPHRPLHLPPANVTDLPPATAAALTTTARLPFAVAVVHAPPSPERTQALHILHSAARSADRKILWCSPTREQAAAAVDDEITDTAATITETHANITSRQWRLPHGSLLIVDEAAGAHPAVLADLAEHAAATKSGLILVDTSGHAWPPKPSQRLLHLLHTELPWTATLTPPSSSDVINRGTPPDLEPALAQTRRLHPSLLDEHLRASLTRADQLHTAINAAYQHHLNATWVLLRQHDRSLEHDSGIEL